MSLPFKVSTMLFLIMVIFIAKITIADAILGEKSSTKMATNSLKSKYLK